MVNARWTTWGRFAALFLAAAAITVLRDPRMLLLPPAAYEDGRDLFAFFYNHREVGAILRSYAGYTSLVPNLVGYLAVRLPVTAVPLALTLFPLAASSLAFAVFSLPAYRHAVASDTLRAAACLVFALVPVGNDLFVGNTMYSVWSLLFLLVLAALAEPPAGLWGAAVRLVVLGMLVASHPLSVALLPIYLLWLWRRRDPPSLLLYPGLILATVAYQVVGVRHAGAALGPPLETVRLTLVFVLERVVFDTLFGDAAARALHRAGHGGWILVAAGAVSGGLAVLSLYRRRRFDPWHRSLAAVLVYLVLVLTALFVIGRSPGEGILAGNRAFRYFWVQRLVFLLLAAFLAERLLALRPGSSRRPLLAAIAVGLVLWVAVLDHFNNGAYRVRARLGRQIEAFTAEVRRQETRGDGAVDARLERGRVWSFELHRPGRTKPKVNDLPE